MSWLPPSDGWLAITDTVALSYEIGWLRHRRIFNFLFDILVSCLHIYNVLRAGFVTKKSLREYPLRDQTVLADNS